MEPLDRFRDPRTSAYDLAQEQILVRCPRCDGLAHVTGGRRFGCPGCGLARTAEGRGGAYARSTAEPAADPFFRLPLWLQTRTRHGWLWAYNAEHLDLIAGLVRARLRERERDAADGGRRNSTLVSRLPLWIKKAEHRDEVLRAVDRIRATLPS
ncbi:hypothetical protein [Actinomadura rugatobispora]|uniref:TFIIB-type zinc ribbon-containing protein n=1 Tax=Actinomadura rugatobispora TaxID=1994 RepID=A0ABW1A4M9_9ACTN